MTQQLNIKYLPISALESAPRNPRTHSRHQIAQIVKSIQEFGFTNPLLIDENHIVIAGHGRIEAAKLLSLVDVPTICINHLTPAQIRAYAIADNKLAENAGWDQEVLSIELSYIAELDIDLDLTLTGFEVGEIDLILMDNSFPTEDPATEPPLSDEDYPLVSEPGDLWQVGNHRILCGDATDPESYDRLMDDEKARLVFTDPPYNVPIQGHVSGLGAIKHPEFEMASGEMSPGEFTRFLFITLEQAARSSVDGAIHFVCMDWRHMSELMEAGQKIYSELKNLCVWNKTNGGMGSLYRSKHELIFVFKYGMAQHVNNVQLGRYGRNRTNVWDYPGATSLHPERSEHLAMHPTVKPIGLVADAILDCSERHDIVLDCFGGSGTTLLAAERTGRRAHLIEIDPKYVDTTIRRYEHITGTGAIHAESGLTFSEMADSCVDLPNCAAGGIHHG